MKGVKCTFVRIDGNGNGEMLKATEPLMKTTAAKGGFNVRNMTDGSYGVTIAKTGFRKQELTVNKAAGDRLDLEVKMMKV